MVWQDGWACRFRLLDNGCRCVVVFALAARQWSVLLSVLLLVVVNLVLQLTLLSSLLLLPL